jgi:ubiquinone biosynthesis protein UbiJ
VKALYNLVRVHRWQLDEKRRQFVQLEKLRADLGRQDEKLAQEMAAEQTAAAKAGVQATTYPAYLQEARARQKRVADSIAEVERQMLTAQQDIAEAYGEVKKYETALAHMEKRDLAKRERTQRIAQDDLAMDMYRRKKSG